MTDNTLVYGFLREARDFAAENGATVTITKRGLSLKVVPVMNDNFEIIRTFVELEGVVIPYATADKIFSALFEAGND